MSDVALNGVDAGDRLVERAARWADALVRAESRGPGDLDNAMRRIARRYRLSHSVLWRLRYRRPRDVLASVYFTLLAAYEAECARQIDRLAHELEITKAVAGVDGRAVRAAQALVDKTHVPPSVDDDGSSDGGAA
ncbi:hypothetical protein [Hansschlegelia sp.]|uniref:hypothetical protein n=1 Tax=Hansschlegelia sp. TaxID=2041892 RepID=UPI002BCE7ABD|nr:hypothetical protein [Hansschlegelia sp.]HVI30438.1 hypothetical protein [Hansschlegelia sp.]